MSKKFKLLKEKPKLNDTLHKQAMKDYSNYFLKSIGINVKVEESLNTEMSISDTTFRADTLVKLKDGTLINIEYHTGGLYEDDLLVYLNYMSLFSLEHQQLIKQYIITTEPKEKYLKQLKKNISSTNQK